LILEGILSISACIAFARSSAYLICQISTDNAVSALEERFATRSSRGGSLMSSMAKMAVFAVLGSGLVVVALVIASYLNHAAG
jgi:hypothetical protein